MWRLGRLVTDSARPWCFSARALRARALSGLWIVCLALGMALRLGLEIGLGIGSLMVAAGLMSRIRGRARIFTLNVLRFELLSLLMALRLFP